MALLNVLCTSLHSLFFGHGEIRPIFSQQVGKCFPQHTIHCNLEEVYYYYFFITIITALIIISFIMNIIYFNNIISLIMIIIAILFEHFISH
jgi:phosphoglycerol transferase MdoB-like AlkP superfamily enzyme